MKLEQAREIANAVLYEGYLLYPYRHSAIKNRQRWTFGVVYPRAYSLANGEIEPWFLRTECLLSGQASTRLDIHVRFLHLLKRESMDFQQEMAGEPTARMPAWRLVSNWQPECWEEGVEREVNLTDLSLADVLARPYIAAIDFPGPRLQDPDGTGSREQQALAGRVRVSAFPAINMGQEHIYKIQVQVENLTPLAAPVSDQHTILLQSFVSTHALLYVEHGHFISLLDPPPELVQCARSCENQRTWPVLVGQPGEDDLLLSSPIILYDYPQIAPESAGGLFDGTEIDEILTLRIMTLTDEEKEQMRRGDSRAREILDRIEALSAEQLMQLHGTMRDLRPLAQADLAGDGFPRIVSPLQQSRADGEKYFPATATPHALSIAGRQVRPGSRVRLHPSARADALDFLLRDKTGRVEALQQDFEQRLYLVVTIDDDPGRDQWDERVMPGHRFFFFPEEIEPLAEEKGGSCGPEIGRA